MVKHSARTNTASCQRLKLRVTRKNKSGVADLDIAQTTAVVRRVGTAVACWVDCAFNLTFASSSTWRCCWRKAIGNWSTTVENDAAPLTY